MTEALLIDPYQPYADLFISRLYRDHGIRTVALHRNWRTRLVLEPRLPILRSRAVSAHYMIPPAGVEALAPMLRSRHHITAVLPHDEGAVWPLARMAELLHVGWSQPRALAAFSSKRLLKDRLRSQDPQLRVNQFDHVASVEDVRTWVEQTGVGRFVLKPDNGSGNRGVAFFERDASDADLAGYFREVPGRILAEEFIGGREFWVNGQIDAAGVPTVTMLGIYDRREINGKENVEFGSHTLASTTPEFTALQDYAVRVMRATGLRRSPFHLEAKIDEHGPCLIEVGARVCGDLAVLTDEWQHGAQGTFIGAAVHDYVTGDLRAPLKLDWSRADSHVVTQVNGASERHMVVGRVDGVDQVEEMPGFLMWTKKPSVGDVVQPTLDLVAKPWGMYVYGSTWDEAATRAEVVRGAVRLTSASDLTGLSARVPMLSNRIQRYLAARPRLYMLRGAGWFGDGKRA